MRDQILEKIASRLYEPKLPYHNFGHVVTVLKESERIIAKCKEEGIEIDEAVVYYALLFHDAGYHKDHAALGYESKEAYSAALADQELKGNGIDQENNEKIISAILATHVDAQCQSNEDKIVRAADLSELAADYATFKKNTLNLKEELSVMTNKTISWEEWKGMAVARVELFLREDMDVTSDYFDSDGESTFRKNAKANLDALLADDSEES